MRLTLFRHGNAEAYHPDGDDARPLSDDGRRRFEKAARLWARLSPAPELILTSPLLRARQSAELLVHAFEIAGAKPDLEIENELSPWGNTEGLLDVLPDRERLVLVSHMPFVGDLAARVLGGSAGPQLWFQTGMGLSCDFEPLSRIGKLDLALSTAVAGDILDAWQ